MKYHGHGNRGSRIAIVGAGPTQWLAPFHNPDWTIVSFNYVSPTLPRVDVHFEMHETIWGPGYTEWLQTRTQPTFLLEPDPRVPQAQRFPIEAVRALGEDFFTSTASYAIGWGLLQTPTHLGLFGLDLPEGSPYEEQRQGVAFWLGVARGRGCELVLPPGNTLLRHGQPYGRSLKATFVKGSEDAC